MIIQYIRYGVMVLLAGIIIFLVWLCWQNRASEKLVTSVLTIALLATSATLITGLFALKEDTIDVCFRKVFVFDIITKEQPIPLLEKTYATTFFGRHENITDIIFLLAEAKRRDPTLTQLVDAKGENIKLTEIGKDLYKNILHYQIISTLFSTCHWNSSVKRYIGPGWHSFSFGPPKDTSGLKAVEWERIKEIAPNNKLLEIESLISDKSFYIPKNMIIKGSNEQLALINSFVTITISIKPIAGSIGTNGLAPLMEMTFFENLKYWTQQYEIDIKVKFNLWKTGHPKMKKYRDWVDHMISELRYYYDSTKLWEETKENFIFHRSLPELPKLTIDDKLKEKEKFHEWITELREKERKALELNSQR